MEFDQTFTTNGLWGKNDCVKFWGQKVKGQGHSGVTYVGGGIIVDTVLKTIYFRFGEIVTEQKIFACLLTMCRAIRVCCMLIVWLFCVSGGTVDLSGGRLEKTEQ